MFCRLLLLLLLLLQGTGRVEVKESALCHCSRSGGLGTARHGAGGVTGRRVCRYDGLRSEARGAAAAGGAAADCGRHHHRAALHHCSQLGKRRLSSRCPGAPETRAGFYAAPCRAVRSGAFTRRLVVDLEHFDVISPHFTALIDYWRCFMWRGNSLNWFSCAPQHKQSTTQLISCFSFLNFAQCNAATHDAFTGSHSEDVHSDTFSFFNACANRETGQGSEAQSQLQR